MIVAMANRDDSLKQRRSGSPPAASNLQQDKKVQGRLYFPHTFEPGNWDVICHNGREFQEHGKVNLS